MQPSFGGASTGEGGDFIIVDDLLSSTQALSETLRKRATNWFGQTLVSRLNDEKKRSHRSCDAQAVPGGSNRAPFLQTEKHMASYFFAKNI